MARGCDFDFSKTKKINKNSKSRFFNGCKKFFFISCYQSHSFKIAGGLEEEVDDKIIHAAFIPFGEITDIQIPIDYETSKHRGFAFVEFELAEDAAAAIDNMNESELYGRTIRVNLAKPMKNKEGGSKAIWNTDEYLQEHVSGENKEKADDELQATSDQTTDEVIVLELLDYWLYTGFFYNQLHFLLQPRGAYGRMNFQSESCLAVDYSIHFQPFFFAQQLLIFNKFKLPSVALIGGRSYESKYSRMVQVKFVEDSL